LRHEFQADNGSAEEGPPINDARARPEVATDRLEKQDTSGFPKALRGDASAAKTDVMRGSGFRTPIMAKVGKLHRLAHDGAIFLPNASIGSEDRFTWGHAKILLIGIIG
jgi:hypothetical protein